MMLWILLNRADYSKAGVVNVNNKFATLSHRQLRCRRGQPMQLRPPGGVGNLLFALYGAGVVGPQWNPHSGPSFGDIEFNATHVRGVGTLQVRAGMTPNNRTRRTQTKIIGDSQTLLSDGPSGSRSSSTRQGSALDDVLESCG